MASPHAGSTTHGQAVARASPSREASTARRGSSPQGRSAPLTGVTARWGGACGHGRMRPTCRGGNRSRAHPLAAWHPGDGVGRWGGRPVVAWLPTGKGSRHLRRGSSDGDDGANWTRGWERGGDSGTHDAVAEDHDAW
ncbi:hypothetical protein B296_00009050 [Ensete ventricosum]|uniref:Uncharacterized protein n=1 Tax=Ensete ventricosum TaxID=4639 RepID=A0A426XI03_ENSVE|nr:hypothetical protein B296_00009050 [Ensete ventricosum]